MRFVRRGARTAIVPVTALIVTSALVLALTVAAGRWLGGRLEPDARTPVAAALDSLPASVVVAGVTDWRQIREQVDADDAALRDLTSRSALAGASETMASPYGWSASDLDWEAYGQTGGGAVLVARLSDDVSTKRVEKGLRDLGYRRSGGVWLLDVQGRARIGPELAATLGAVAVLGDERLIVAGGGVDDVRQGLATVRHGARSLLERRPVAELAAQLVGADSVLLQSGSGACRSAAVGTSDPEVAAQASTAVGRAGALARPKFAGRGLFDDGRRQDISFVAAFESPAQAAQQARVRAQLASGPFIGRSGRVEDSLDLTGATARGAVATLRFDLDPDRGAYMSGEGPLLFASCP